MTELGRWPAGGLGIGRCDPVAAWWAAAGWGRWRALGDPVCPSSRWLRPAAGPEAHCLPATVEAWLAGDRGSHPHRLPRGRGSVSGFGCGVDASGHRAGPLFGT